MTKGPRTVLAKCLPSAVAIGIALLATSVRADEILLTTGTACNPNRANAGIINYSSTWGILNESSTVDGTVYCPITITDSDQWWGARSVILNVIDQNSTKDVTCTINALNTDGSIGFAQNTKSSGSSTTVQQLRADLMEGFIHNSICKLPSAPSSSRQSRLLNFGTEVHD